MEDIKGIFEDQTLTISLAGRIDSGNAAEVEEKGRALLEQYPDCPVCIDMQELEYISSAGLRILLRLRKKTGDLRLVNVSPEIFEILEMTGFTEMMTVEKAYRSISVEGCEVIGEGANGKVYRIDGDNVVKVYKDADALDEIHHEREVARLALVMGIPTAISYDVVKVGDSYGSVFELLDARTFSKILSQHPEKMDWCLREYVDLLKKIHDTVVPKGKLPDIRTIGDSWAQTTAEHLPEEAGQKLLRLFEAIPPDDHMIHGDYHTKNVVLSGDEVLLIDMDTLATGHPVFELAAMYNAFIGFGELDHSNTDRFMGFDHEAAAEFWRRSLAAYLGTENEEIIHRVEEKARVISYARLISRPFRHGGIKTEKEQKEFELWKEHLLEILDHVDSLTFLRNEIHLKAEKKNLPKAISFACAHLEEAGCGLKAQMQIEVAVEEIFVNICSYAYGSEIGDVAIRMEVSGDPATAVLTFRDQGIPYDPLKKEDPDITLPADQREIGGLGIFMTKEIMDEKKYEYRDGSNILTLTKYLTD